MTMATIEALADALGTSHDKATKWLRRGPEYYSQKAMPTLDPFKAFRKRVVASEAAEAGWRVVTADDIRDEESFYRQGGTNTARGDKASIL